MSKKKKSTPFSDTGAIIGRSLGGMFGNSSIGSGIGKWLGTGIGSIFGSGDYTLAGQPPSYNVLTNGKQTPQFSTTAATNIVCHREYLGDIQGTAGFNNTSYPLNPGLQQTFPWLATVAENYQEYKFHGVVFEFRPLITDFVTSGAPGVIIMSTNYNADVPLYTTKQQMENAEFAVSVKPTLGLMHGIECATDSTTFPKRYIRSGAVPSNQDLRLYDYGNFQFATQTNPVQALGELWVSYCVEFMKPVLPETTGGDILSYHGYRTGANGTNPFGTTSAGTPSGTLSVTVTNAGFSFLAQPLTRYLVVLSISGISATIVNPSVSLVNCSYVNVTFGTSPSVNAPQTAGVTGIWTFTTMVVSNLLSASNIGINLSGATLPAGTADLVVTQIDSVIVT
uniref:Capsid protein n=1 Tax=Riboviria sp. TaxID=2585031 RepID=A0A514D3G6_9VIRU|nr:MAG: hypothetical protein H1BulkLitter52246_000001 [Riboviria sp.]